MYGSGVPHRDAGGATPSHEEICELLAASPQLVDAVIGARSMLLGREVPVSDRSAPRRADIVFVTSDAAPVFCEVKTRPGDVYEARGQLRDLPQQAARHWRPDFLNEQWQSALAETGVHPSTRLRQLRPSVAAAALWQQVIANLRAGRFHRVLVMPTAPDAVIDAVREENAVSDQPPIDIFALRPSRGLARPRAHPDASVRVVKISAELRRARVRHYADKGCKRAEIARRVGGVSTRTIDRDIEALTEAGWAYRPERIVSTPRTMCADRCGRVDRNGLCPRCRKQRHMQFLRRHPDLTNPEAAAELGLAHDTVRAYRRELRPSPPERVSYASFDVEIRRRWNRGDTVPDIAAALDIPESGARSRVQRLQVLGLAIKRWTMADGRRRALDRLADRETDTELFGGTKAARLRGTTARRLGKQRRNDRQRIQSPDRRLAA